jgi:DnaK suppressor protein
MNSDERDIVKKEIEKRIVETRNSIQELRELTKPIQPDVSLGRLTRMEAINEKSINEDSLRKAEHTLSGLESALSRIDDVDFGICLRCKDKIPSARILRVPESRVCVNCLK